MLRTLSVYLMTLGLLVPLPSTSQATGDAANRFQVFVPPNNVASNRRSMMMVTNVSPTTASVSIIDRGEDGDTDDSVNVSLTRGQTYVLRIADGAVNDDVGGKHDGDHFQVLSDHPVVVQIATQSNWQHDWVPAEGNGGIGRNFFVYAPATSGADNDINVFAYEDDTYVTIRDITVSPLLTTGATQVDLADPPLVLSATLHQGEDLIVRENGLGLDVLDPGRSYWVQATRPVTVQYGHLGQVSGGNQARDGAGFVPSVNGSASGELYYFAIPHNPGREKEKELRVVCFDDNTTVQLYGSTANEPDWELISQSTVNAGAHLDFVGVSNAAFRDADLYKLTVDPPYQRCNVFEGNWMETGSFGTSDFASMGSGRNGTHLAHQFTLYVGPPGIQNAVVNPTGEQTNAASTQGGYGSHLYIFAETEDTGVTVRHIDSGGAAFEHSFVLGAGDYYDVVMSKQDYLAMTAGSYRPYVEVLAAHPVAVLSGNFNDNWMAFYHSVQPATPRASVGTSAAAVSCGGTIPVTVTCSNPAAASVEDATVTVSLPNHLVYAPESASVEPLTVTGESMTFVLGDLAPDSETTLTLEVSADCEGCVNAALLADLTVECNGTMNSDLLASIDSVQLTISPSDGITVDGFQVLDLPDYDGNPPNPRVAGVANVTASVAGAEVTVLRATNNPDPNAPMTTVQTFPNLQPGTSVLSFEDTYALHYEKTRFYRLKIVENGCETIVGPISVTTSSGSSGGEDSGLESNGRLANDLARRAIARSRAPMWQAPPTNLPTQPLFARLSLAGSFTNLAALLPPEGPGGSAPVNADPGDLPGLTNANTTQGVDYLDLDGERVATALLIETRGGAYEHSKPLCDRAGGSVLTEITPIQTAFGALPRFALAHPETGVGDFSYEVRVVETAAGEWQLYTAWLGEQLPPLNDDQRVITAQVWSARRGYAAALLEDVLEGIGLTPTDATATPPLPRAWFASAALRGREVAATLELPEETTDVELRVTRLHDDGSETVQTLPASADVSWLEDIPLGDATLELLVDGRVEDRAWIGDGAWAELHDGMFGGATQMTTSDRDACRWDDAATDYPIAFSGCVAGGFEVATFAGFARHFGGSAAGLTLPGGSAVSFWLESNRPTRACFEGDGERSCANLTAEPDGRRVTVPLTDFDGAPEHIRAELFSVIAHGEGALALEVGRLAIGPAPSTVPEELPAATDIPEPADLGAQGCDAGDGSSRRLPGLMVLATLALMYLGRRRRSGMGLDRL